MTLTLTLSREELIEISGYRRPSKIADWFKRNGYPLDIGADGWPRIVREHYLTLRIGKVAPKSPTVSNPNVAALMERQRNGKKTHTTTRSA